MTDFTHHTPRLLSEADAAADLAGVSQLVSTMEAQALAAMLIVHAGDHKDVAYECDMNPVHTLNWKHHETSLSASKALLTLVSERDALAARVAELETEVLDQCRLNGMGSERELALMARVAELEAERDAAAEVSCGAVRKAFSLGQTYWQQADSEYTSQHRKAEGTWATFKALIEETRAALSATTPESKP